LFWLAPNSDGSRKARASVEIASLSRCTSRGFQARLADRLLGKLVAATSLMSTPAGAV
jgi:hypothetical protein